MNTAYKWLFLVLLFAAPAYSQNVRVDNVAFSSVQGFPFLPGATITICTAAGAGLPCTPTVAGTCLSISDAVCNQSATLTSDAFGNYGFWIQPGSYTYTVTKAGFGGFGPRALTLAVPSVGTGPGTFTSLSVSGTGTFTGNVTATAGQNKLVSYNINNRVLIDGVKYACSPAGLTSGLTDVLGPANGITAASETGLVVTLTLNTSPSIPSGTVIYVTGVGVGGYNGVWTTTGGTTNTVTYNDNASVLGASSGGNLTTQFGTVDATGCLGTIASQLTSTITIPPFVNLLLGPSTWTCNITAANTPCWLIVGHGARFLGMQTLGDPTVGDSGSDPPLTLNAGVTNLMCTASCSSTTDMIAAAIPTAQRTGYSNSLLNSVEIGGFWINMGGAGRHAIHDTSCHFCNIHDTAAYNFAGDGLHHEGELTGQVNQATSYFTTIERILMQAPHSNTTGSSCMEDATAGEVTWGTYRSIRCSGNITNGGGQYGFLVKTGSAANLATHQQTLIGAYIGNTIDETNSGGLILLAPGNWANLTLGRITDWTFQGILVEKLNAGTLGTCIGGQSAAGTAGGAGLGGLVFNSVTCNSTHWAVGMDEANLGMHTTNAGSTNNTNNGMIFTLGDAWGNNSGSIFDRGTSFAQSNSDTLRGFRTLRNWNMQSKTGVTVYGLDMDCSNDVTVTGTPGNFSCIHINAPQAATTNPASAILLDNFGNGLDLQLNNGGITRFVEGATPSLAALAANDDCYGDSTAHTLKCRYNGGSYFNVPLIGIANTWTATQTFGAGSSINFTSLLTSPTAPTIAAAGCGGAAAAITAPNGTGSFEVSVGTTPGSACTITMPAATTSWTCDANTVSATTTTNYMVKQTGALSTTSVVLTLFSDAAVATAFQGSDTLRVKCSAN